MISTFILVAMLVNFGLLALQFSGLFYIALNYAGLMVLHPSKVAVGIMIAEAWQFKLIHLGIAGGLFGVYKKFS